MQSNLEINHLPYQYRAVGIYLSYLTCLGIMPITDTVKKQIAQQRRLYFKICFKCGAKNPISSERCRKCHSKHM